MRTSSRRSEKYRKKIRGLVLPGQEQHFRSKIAKQVEIEQAVNGIVGSDINRPYYIIFAKEILQLQGKYSGQTLYDEVCIRERKWNARGLTLEKLNAIENYMNVPVCVVAPPCSYWETEEECVAAGCYWYDGSCHAEPPPCPEDWCNVDWTYRKKIVIDHTQLSGNLADWPLLVRVTDTDIRDHAKADGSDIMFCTPEKVKLSREIEKYNSATGKLEVWVKVPAVSASVDTEIYIYYGNAAGAETNDTATWDNNYKLVQHLIETPPAATQDSTANNNDGAPQNMEAGDQVEGVIDGSLNFDGVDEYITVQPAGSINLDNSDFTLEAWYKPANTSEQHCLMAKGDVNAPDQWLHLYMYNGTQVAMAFWGDDLNVDYAWSAGNWYYVVGRFIASTKEQRLYVNGASVGSRIAGGVLLNTDNRVLFLGARAGPSWFIPGIMDEDRVSLTPRSADWILANYNSQKPGSTFITLEAEEEC